MAVATASKVVKTYEQLVAEGRQIVRERDGTNWKAGDLALEVESLPPEQRPQAVSNSSGGVAADTPLKQYAQEIEVNYSTLCNWRATAEAWPKPRRHKTRTWATHKALNAQLDRFELIARVRTKAEAEKEVRDRDAPEGKPETLPASFDERLVHALGQLAGETTPFENLVRSNDGRKFRDRHMKTCARYALVARAAGDLLAAIGDGEYEAINAQAFMDVLHRPWAEEGLAHGDDHR